CEREIHPDTPLARFLPSERRREFWTTAQRQFGLRLPALRLPLSMQIAGHWLTLAAVGRTVLIGLVLGAKWIVLPLVFVTWLLTSAFYDWITRPWATELPGLETFGDLSRMLLARNVKTFRSRFGLKPNRDEIYAAVAAILAEQLGVDPREITWDTRFDELIG
ncbi:MAG TPA: hypothetical protein VFB80_07880, partial [Pirellulaceae bacterium]|nr:hypothetical protein [Pirellulaceae bacterium]